MVWCAARAACRRLWARQWGQARAGLQLTCCALTASVQRRVSHTSQTQHHSHTQRMQWLGVQAAVGRTRIVGASESCRRVLPARRPPACRDERATSPKKAVAVQIHWLCAARAACRRLRARQWGQARADLQRTHYDGRRGGCNCGVGREGGSGGSRGGDGANGGGDLAGSGAGSLSSEDGGSGGVKGGGCGGGEGRGAWRRSGVTRPRPYMARLPISPKRPPSLSSATAVMKSSDSLHCKACTSRNGPCTSRNGPCTSRNGPCT